MVARRGLVFQHFQVLSHPRFGIAGGQKIRNHGHRSRSSLNHAARSGQGDAANPDNGPSTHADTAGAGHPLRGGARHAGRALDEVEANSGMPGFLRRGAEDGPDRDVVDRLCQSGADLFGRVRGEPDHRRFTQHFACRRGGQIFLTHVHTGGAAQPRDVGAIVNNDNGPVRSSQLDDPIAHCQIFAAAQPLRPDLEKSCAASQARPREVGHAPTRGLGRISVKDGVQAGKVPISNAQTASASFPWPLVLLNRSMNDVLSLPAMKSGSCRMRRCSGMVVLTPSMTAMSSVRRIRAIAS